MKNKNRGNTEDIVQKRIYLKSKIERPSIRLVWVHKFARTLKPAYL